MKPLIYATYHTHVITREEDHLHRAIKSCLDANKIKYATNVFEDYDLVHFISAKDLNKLSEVKKAYKPSIVNALYCESEKSTSMSHYYSEKRTLRTHYIKYLKDADLILVPGEKAKKLLEKEKIKTKIEIFPTPVDLNKFKLTTKEANKYFSSYFEKEDDDFILCIGDYKNKTEMENLMEIINLASFTKFYFLGANYSQIAESKYVKKAPYNVIFSDLLDYDTYRAAICKSKILLVLDSKKSEAPNVLEAMAANTQVIVYNSNSKNDSYLKDGYNCYMRDGMYAVVECIENCLKHKIPSTTKNAFNFVKQYSLNKSGIKLKQIYLNLLKNK